MRLSNRMEAVAAYVTSGKTMADVGTDHGYIPIALVQRGIVPDAIAMDVKECPLARAREHIAQARLQERIQTRLSDGLAALMPGEAHTIVIAGMGGELMIHILQEGMEVALAAGALVLQPQSELQAVRKFLREQGFVTEQENMICEDGKYYPLMRVAAGKKGCPDSGGSGAYTEELLLADRYGALLLRGKNASLASFLEKEHAKQEQILKGLYRKPRTETILERIRQLEQAKTYNEKAQVMIQKNGNGENCYAGISDYRYITE